MSTGTPAAQRPAAPVRCRRNADRLTETQLENLRAALRGVCENARPTPCFLPWHRAHLDFFEWPPRDRSADASHLRARLATYA